MTSSIESTEAETTNSPMACSEGPPLWERNVGVVNFIFHHDMHPSVTGHKTVGYCPEGAANFATPQHGIGLEILTIATSPSDIRQRQ